MAYKDIEKKREWHRINNPRRMYWRGKQIVLKENPRKGICQQCGRTDLKTDIHHTRYDGENPLDNTIELCVSCHGKESYRLGQITGLVKGWGK